MTPFCRSGCGALQRGLLRCASLLVPAPKRGEWRREWLAELWHVRQASVPASLDSWQAECEVAWFCLGAFQDAFFLRGQSRQRWKPLASLQGSPAQCVLFLGAVLAACYLAAVLLPGVRAERSLARCRAYAGIVFIRNARSASDAAPTILPRQFRAWVASRQRYFDGFAFYRIARSRVSVASPGRRGWRIAYVTANLFTLLGVPVRFAAAEGKAESSLPGMILSDRAWKADFGGNPRIVGSVVRVDARDVRITGVAPAGSWRLPEKVDAWLLDPDSAAGGPGYVVAHLTAAGQSEMWAPRELITAYGPGNSEEDLLGVLLDERMPSSWAVFLFGVLLALLALPATVSVSMSEYSLHSHKPSWQRRLCRWGFLSAKIALLLPIAYFASLDLAYAGAAPFVPLAVYLHLGASFSICLLALSWACRDQRQRCPVCLRRVAHPAQVGSASQTFLGWNGTELMCMSGHTLLHVPALPTSWFGTQRWLYLDGSWEFLFAG